MSEVIHTTTDAIDAKGLQSRSLRGQQAVIDAKLHEDLKGALLVLLRHHNDWTGLCCPGQDLIAAKLGVTENTVRARLRKIEQRGLVTIHRTGRWTRYAIHFEAINALEPAAVPVDNSRDTLNRCPRHPQNTHSTPANHEADTLKLCALTDKGTGYSTEEGTEPQAQADNATAAIPAEIALPPLLESATTLAIQPDTLAALNAKLFSLGRQLPDLDRMSRTAEFFDTSVQHVAESMLAHLKNDEWLETPTSLVARSLRHLADDLAESPRGITLAEAVSTVMTGLASDVVRSPNTTEFRGTPAHAVGQALLTIAETVVEPSAPAAPVMSSAPAADRAVAIDPETLAAVNAQRAANGKTAWSRADLQDLGRQATLAGIAPQAAAEWVLAKPSRNFFKAEWLLDKPAAQAASAPIDEAARAQARARAEQVQAELLRASIAAMRRDDGIVLPPSAVRLPLQQTVTVRNAAPVSVGDGGLSNTRRNAEQWLSDYAAGRPFRQAQFELALSVTGRSRDELRAQRAAAKARLQAAIGGAA